MPNFEELKPGFKRLSVQYKPTKSILVPHIEPMQDDTSREHQLKRYDEVLNKIRSTRVDIPDTSASRKAVERASESFDRLKQIYRSSR